MTTRLPTPPRAAAILRRLRAPVLCGVLLAAAAAHGAPGAALAILGSSSAAGVGASDPALSWAGRLRGWLQHTDGATVENLAVPGALTDSALCTQGPSAAAHTLTQALALGATRVILAFPSNDAVAGLPAAHTVANIQQMVACARLAGARIAVMSSLPRAGLTLRQRQAIRNVDQALQSAYGSCFLDVHSPLAHSTRPGVREPYSAGDGIHLNDAGHDLIFRAVRQFMESGQCL